MLMSVMMTSASAATAEGFTASSYATDAVDANARADRLAVVLERVVDSWNSDREIATIKEISDFAGNTYMINSY